MSSVVIKYLETNFLDSYE